MNACGTELSTKFVNRNWAEYCAAQSNEDLLRIIGHWEYCRTYYHGVGLTDAVNGVTAALEFAHSEAQSRGLEDPMGDEWRGGPPLDPNALSTAEGESQ